MHEPEVPSRNLAWIPVREALLCVAIALVLGMAMQRVAMSEAPLQAARIAVALTAMVGVLTGLFAVRAGIRWGETGGGIDGGDDSPVVRVVRDLIATTAFPLLVAAGAMGGLLAGSVPPDAPLPPRVHAMLVGIVAAAPAWAGYGALCLTLAGTRRRAAKLATLGLVAPALFYFLWLLATGEQISRSALIAWIIVVPAPSFLSTPLMLADRCRYVVFAILARFALARLRQRRALADAALP